MAVEEEDSAASFRAAFRRFAEGGREDAELVDAAADPADVISRRPGWFGEAPGSGASCFGLSRQQRAMGFVVFLASGAVCLAFAFLLVPFLLFKARKFCLLFTLGSGCTLGSFAMLWGPWALAMHLVAMQRLPFTSAYLGSMAATLYAAMRLQSTLLTLLFAGLQVATLLFFVMSNVPGGAAGLRLMLRLFAKGASKAARASLPV